MIKSFAPKVTGHVVLQLRKGDKLVKEVIGHNVWTNTGREFLSELIAFDPSNQTTFREDRIAYMGIGQGTQAEEVTVTQLVDSVAWDTYIPNQSPNFLAPIDLVEFPAGDPSYVAVRFVRDYSEDELLGPSNSSQIITEAGLFTNGNPSNNWAVDGFDTSLVLTGTFAPLAYKTFEPITKTQDYTLRVSWEVRFS